MNMQVVIRDGLNYRFQAILYFLDHLTFVAAFDLVASLDHEFDRDLIGKLQLANADQSYESSLDLLKSLPAIEEISIHLLSINSGSNFDRLSQIKSFKFWRFF